MSAALTFDSRKARQILGSQKLRFATKEELRELTSAVSGALPPFGRPVQDFDLYIDKSLLENEVIAFNAGLLTCSFIMNTQDWYQVQHFKFSHCENFYKDLNTRMVKSLKLRDRGHAA